jgi:hypothetical protein
MSVSFYNMKYTTYQSVTSDSFLRYFKMIGKTLPTLPLNPRQNVRYLVRFQPSWNISKKLIPFSSTLCTVPFSRSSVANMKMGKQKDMTQAIFSTANPPPLFLCRSYKN